MATVATPPGRATASGSPAWTAPASGWYRRTGKRPGKSRSAPSPARTRPAHCFSADGSRLYILRNEGVSAKLEELVLATDELRTLTTLPGSLPEGNYNRGMRLHPDGKSVVFTSGEVTTTFWLVDGVTAALNR